MIKRIFQHLLPITISLSLFVSCLGESGGRRKVKKTPRIDDLDQTLTGSDGRPIGGVGGDINGDGEVGEVITEVKHFIDPFDKTFKTKLTLPKNFTGQLALSGLNIGSLGNRLIRVRFRFGRNLTPIPSSGIEATVTRINSQTTGANINVLLLDIKASNPIFENVPLEYQLFDYNNYSPGQEPVMDPRNSNLYCRGLKLDYDPTFESNSGSCSQKGDKCLYAYAKIKDAGLYLPSGISFFPARPNIAQSANLLNDEKAKEKLFRCLPDNGELYMTSDGGNKDLVTPDTDGAIMLRAISKPYSWPNGGDPTREALTVNNISYQYYGPYQTDNMEDWELSKDAAIHNHLVETDITKNSPRGLFMDSGDGGIEGGIYSYLFPRSVNYQLKPGVEYLGESLIDASSENLFMHYLFSLPRTGKSVLDPGTSQHMDGCNMRVRSFNAESIEGIHSCNVNAYIEVYTINSEGEEETILTNKALKIQLIRPSLKDSKGENISFGAYNSCETDNACGAGECCYNRKCLPKDVTSQCKEELNLFDNKSVNEACTSDFQCSSLCCQQGICQAHDTTGETKAYCEKPAGAECVAKDWCDRVSVTEYALVKNPGSFNVFGCQVVPNTVEKSGECVARRCQQPKNGVLIYKGCPNGDCGELSLGQIPEHPTPEFCLKYAVDNPF